MQEELIDTLIPNLLAIFFTDIVLATSLYWGLKRILVRLCIGYPKA
ncbi:MAG: hypothetical protein HC887_13205 [Desulfobacteraceae bacterium]|nr:hypothetical protein [Desulfobacteraceae bacterium]